MNIGKLKEQIRYGIVGVLNTLAYYVSIYLLYVKLHYNEYLAIFIAYIVAFSIAAILNLLFTFKRYKKSTAIIYQYIKVVFIVFLANCLFTKIGLSLASKGFLANHPLLNGNQFISLQVLFSILFFILNYLLIKRKVFNEHQS